MFTGGSAGGHLALLEAQGAPTERFADPTLPDRLASVEVQIDAVAGLVGPTDLFTLWQAGGIGPPSSESLLGCTQAPEPAIAGMPPCDDAVVAYYSPLSWSKRYADDGGILPPAYLAYGGQDALVTIESQGIPNIDLWTVSAGSDQTWADLNPSAGHNIDDSVNYIAFNAWLARVASGDWASSRQD